MHTNNDRVKQHSEISLLILCVFIPPQNNVIKNYVSMRSANTHVLAGKTMSSTIKCVLQSNQIRFKY